MKFSEVSNLSFDEPISASALLGQRFDILACRQVTTRFGDRLVFTVKVQGLSKPRALFLAPTAYREYVKGLLEDGEALEDVTLVRYGRAYMFRPWGLHLQGEGVKSDG